MAEIQSADYLQFEHLINMSMRTCSVDGSLRRAVIAFWIDYKIFFSSIKWKMFGNIDPLPRYITKILKCFYMQFLIGQLSHIVYVWYIFMEPCNLHNVCSILFLPLFITLVRLSFNIFSYHRFRVMKTTPAVRNSELSYAAMNRFAISCKVE